ncbi:endonuclease/exonuclease/phosphatase family protein [Streptomyces sp. t39]|uniref:endonuclease/exonuclease/phosphatase family protein n=1 Tax=Streptomyces sp. t39 TaxID=1828156 RepID=UPI0011CDE24C|nr:endonuclease/exonuclease/phosphatase family protein [Streptomyces sp. t39]TXS56075.1 endonuclease/exonuclease/phosphatase family protein [Streptomyces sp. t39]
MHPASSPVPGPTAAAASRPARGRAVVWAAGLLLVPPTAVVACRAADRDGITPVIQLLAFLPWLLVPAGLALLLALLGRRPLLVAWAVAVLAVTGWYARPYDTGLADRPPGPVVARVDVLTANVQYGWATEALIEAVRRERPGIVFVQECPRSCVLALARGVPRADYPHRLAAGGEGAAGSALLSRYPLEPADGVSSALAMPGATADVEGRPVDLQLAHPLPPVPSAVGDWRRELGRLGTWAASHRDRPALIAGDFNATGDHAAFRRILDRGGLRDGAALAGAARTPSWPARLPRPLGAQIDHVLVGDAFSVRSARFLDLSGTDHRALLVSLELHGMR